MTQANLRKRASPRRSRMRAFAVTAAWCGVAAAQIGANPAPSCVPQIGIGIWSTAPLVVAAWAPVFDAAVGQSYSFSPIVSNAAGPVVFSIANQPPWAVFDYTTGQLSGIPSNTDVGTYPGVVIAVSDGINSASLPIPLQVLPSQPVPPVIMGTPPFVTVAGGLTCSCLLPPAISCPSPCRTCPRGPTSIR